jgi:septation ring formation regulator EzrA
MAHAIAQRQDNIYAAAAFSFCRLTLYQLRALVEQQPELVADVAHALPGLLQLSPDRQHELGIYQRHHHAAGQHQLG